MPCKIGKQSGLWLNVGILAERFTRNLVNVEWNSKSTWNFFIGGYHCLSEDSNDHIADENYG